MATRSLCHLVLLETLQSPSRSASRIALSGALTSWHNSVKHSKDLTTLGLLNDFDFDAAVLATAFVGVVLGLGLLVAATDALDDAGFFNAVLD